MVVGVLFGKGQYWQGAQGVNHAKGLIFGAKPHSPSQYVLMNPRLLAAPPFFVARFNELKAKHYTGKESDYINLTIGTPPHQPPWRYVGALVKNLIKNLWKRMIALLPEPLHKYTVLGGDEGLKKQGSRLED